MKQQNRNKRRNITKTAIINQNKRDTHTCQINCSAAMKRVPLDTHGIVFIVYFAQKHTLAISQQ